MNHRFAVTRPDGGVTILVVVPMDGEDEKDLHARAARDVAKVYGEALPMRAIAEADVPADRTFRNAWTDDGKAIGCDLGRAREIVRETVRQARAGKLEALDVEMIRALGEGAAKKDRDAIEVKKQRLRDAPADPRIDRAADVVSLKAALAAVVAEIG